ncbi:MAG: hypothetical protein GY720_18870 [bacterium]|nr:hypothetical protein [bacterium]
MNDYQPSENDATFHVRQCFGLESRNFFVMAGDIVEGRIASGMEVAIPLNSAVSVTVVITGVEFIDAPDRHEVGLTVKCETREEVELLLALNVEDERLTVRATQP